MASCRQIETMLQAWIDNELGHAERVILEQHIADCKPCAALLRKHQTSAALLFETFEEHRLARGLRQAVLDHLPEMEPSRMDASLSNGRRRGTLLRSTWAAQFAPVFAALAVLFFAGVLYMEWPAVPVSGMDYIGVVTQSAGNVQSQLDGKPELSVASIKDYVRCGQRYETGPDGKLMLTLQGPTDLKVAENSSVRVYDNREVSVEKGHIWLNVAKSDRQFRVNMPTGAITVLGTVFEVRVEDEKTTVTVQNGKVHVADRAGASEIQPGQQASFDGIHARVKPEHVDVVGVMRWAETIEADPAAYDLFATLIQPRSIEEIQGDQVFVVITNGGNQARSVSSFFITWDPDAYVSGHCSYDIHVYNDAMKEIFSDHVDGSVFANKEKHSYEVQVPGKPISGVNVIHIKLVPDFHAGSRKTSFTKVTALGV